MCGIAGIVSLNGLEPRTLVAMTQMIAYRGPDAYGFAYTTAGADARVEIRHCDLQIPTIPGPQVGLGNRRLAILDLSSTGNQPMQTEDGDLCVTFNGEIYNYLEIRETLQRLGHRFLSNTDTEVILRSYRAWGQDCLEQFNGMWSFALWDRRKQVLFCSRDRFGVKPFYFCSTGRTFYFGSEIKQVLHGSGIKRIANQRAVADFLEFGLQDHLEQTSFENVFQLLAGHSLSLQLTDPLRPIIRRYWELKVEPELNLTPKSAVETFREHFHRAVTIRLRSDVPIGVSLSGGLDSSAIACEARRAVPGARFKCFSACFDETALDERPYVSAITASMDGLPLWVSPDGEGFWKSIETIAHHQDEPIGGPSVFAQWSVMLAAQRNDIRVLLGGQGGDETLCGYNKYYFFYVWHLLCHLEPTVFREASALAKRSTQLRWSIGSAARYLPHVAQKKISALKLLASAELRKLPPVDEFLGPGSSLAQRQKIDLLKTSLPKLLRHEDRNSMAHSVETRLPFLDYRLVEFLLRCPSSFKLRGGWTKWILREALKGTLPDLVRLRKSKLGFDTPESEWLRMGLNNRHQNLWQNPDLRMQKYLSYDGIRRECRRFLAGERGALPAETLFRAVSLEIWARVHNVD